MTQGALVQTIYLGRFAVHICSVLIHALKQNLCEMLFPKPCSGRTRRHSKRCSLIFSIPTGYLWDQCPMGSRSLGSEERGDGIQLGSFDGTGLRHLP